MDIQHAARLQFPSFLSSALLFVWFGAFCVIVGNCQRIVGVTASADGGMRTMATVHIAWQSSLVTFLFFVLEQAPRTPPRDHKMQPTLTTIPPGSTATVPIILLKVQDVLQTSSAYVVTFLVVDGSSGQVPEFTKVGAGAQWVPSIPHQKLVLNSDITEGAVGTPSFIYCNTRDRLKALKEQPSWTPAEKAERKQYVVGYARSCRTQVRC